MTDRDDLEAALRRMEERFGVTESILVVHEAPVTGDWADTDGEPVDPDDVDPETQVIVIQQEVVMSRERAEHEGYEILGPADTPQDDVVRVDWEGGS